MDKIKEIYQHNGTDWGDAIPIGVDAEYIDVVESGTTKSLTAVLAEIVEGQPDVYIATYDSTTYAELNSAIESEKIIIVKNIPYDNCYITAYMNHVTTTSSKIELFGLVELMDNRAWNVDIEITSSSVWTATVEHKDSFMLYDFTLSIDVTIPSCQQDIPNTSVPNVDVIIDDTLGADWAIASLVKYEVKDASGNRLNVWPVCAFSMNTQKTLRLRMMAAGPNAKVARSISGAMLLKSR